MSETENGFPYPEPEDDIDVAGDFKRLAETTDTQLSSVREELSGYLDSTQFQSRFQNLNKPVTGSYEMTYGGIAADGYTPGDMIVEETTLNGGLQAINRVDGDDPYRGSFLCISQFYLEKSLLDSAFVSDIEARQSLSMLNEFFVDYADWQKKLWSSGYNQISPTGRWSCSGHAIQDGVDPNTPYKDLERDLNNLSDADGNVPDTLEDAVSASHYRQLEFGFNEQTGDELRAGQFRRGYLVQSENAPDDKPMIDFKADNSSSMFVATLVKSTGLLSMKRHAIQVRLQNPKTLYTAGGEHEVRLNNLEADLQNKIAKSGDELSGGLQWSETTEDALTFRSKKSLSSNSKHYLTFGTNSEYFEHVWTFGSANMTWRSAEDRSPTFKIGSSGVFYDGDEIATKNELFAAVAEATDFDSLKAALLAALSDDEENIEE